MDRKILPAAVLVVIAAVAICNAMVTPFLALPGPAAKETVKIGVVAPFTGSQAGYGDGVKEGLTLALEEINNDPNSRVKIGLLFEDNAGNVKDSVSAAQKLISIDGVPALISVVSQHSVAIAPIADQRRVVLYTMASQAKELAVAGEFVFKNDDDLGTLGGSAAEFFFGMGHRDVAVLFAEYNDATVDAKDSFVKRFGELGGTVVALEGYDKGETDFRTRLAKIVAAKPTALFLDTLQGDNVAALKQINELGLGMQLFANGTVEDQQVVDGAGNAAEGIIFLTFQGFPSDAFVQKSEAKFGHYPKRWAAEAYDGLKILAAALSNIKGGITSDSLRGELSKIREFDGESGPITFDAQGNARRGLFIKEIKGGKFVPYK